MITSILYSEIDKYRDNIDDLLTLAKLMSEDIQYSIDHRYVDDLRVIADLIKIDGIRKYGPEK